MDDLISNALDWLYDVIPTQKIRVGFSRHKSKEFDATPTQATPGMSKNKPQVETHTWFFLVSKEALDLEGIKVQPGLQVYWGDQTYDVVPPKNGVWEFNDQYEKQVAIKCMRISSETNRNSRTSTKDS